MPWKSGTVVSVEISVAWMVPQIRPRSHVVCNVSCVMSMYQFKSLDNCPAFCDMESYLLSISDLEAIIHPILREMQDTPKYHDVIPRSLDVSVWYRLERSCRRGAENTALDRCIHPNVVNFVHRWSKFERNKGKLPGFDMMQHCAAGSKTRYMQLQFSESL